MTTAELIIRPDGTIVGIYSDTIDYKALGDPQIRRASHVEPTEDARWTADLAPVGGPILGPFERRENALACEVEYDIHQATGQTEFSFVDLIIAFRKSRMKLTKDSIETHHQIFEKTTGKSRRRNCNKS